MSDAEFFVPFLEPHRKPISCVAFSQDGSYLCTGEVSLSVCQFAIYDAGLLRMQDKVLKQSGIQTVAGAGER